MTEGFAPLGPLSLRSANHKGQNEEVDSADAWRAVLVSQVLSSNWAVFARQRNLSPWGADHESCLLCLQYSNSSLPNDQWLCNYARAEHLFNQIAQELEFHSPAFHSGVSHDALGRKIQACRDLLLDWKLKLPPGIPQPTRLFCEQVAIAYMNEVVLHTATNRESFAAPYVVERISVTDFPAPVVSEDHILALLELRDAAQATIELFTGFGPDLFMALPALLFASRALYAMYILCKMYIAVSAKGNTYGSFVPPDALQMAKYFGLLIDAFTTASEIDERAGSSRLLEAAIKMKNWHNNYAASLDALSNGMYPLEDRSVGETHMLPAPLTLDDGLAFFSQSADYDDLLSGTAFDTLLAEMESAGVSLDTLLHEDP